MTAFNRAIWAATADRAIRTFAQAAVPFSPLEVSAS